MKFFLKILCLLSFLSSFCFSENLGRGFTGARNASLDFYAGSLPSVNASFLSNNFIKIDNDVFQSSSPLYLGFNFSLGVSWAGFRADFKNNYLFFYNPSFQKQDTYCQFDKDNNLGCSDEYEKYVGQGDFRKITFSYLERYIISKFTTCNAGENFNTNLKQCVPACPAGQSWDSENNLCYSDCSDKDLNKYGYSNGTAQGGCVDCSSAFTDHDIASCICSGFGTTLSEKGIYLNLEGNSFVSYNCADGRDIVFKRRSNENTEKDKDKDKENPKPDKDKDKKNDNNSTNSSNKDNPNPDKKDNNENSNNSSGESGNPSNNNSGGSSGNGSSGGGGTGVETKPNPNHNGNGKEDGKGDGKQDGKGEEGKGDDNIGPAKLDYEGLKASSETFEGQFKTAIDDSFSFVNDVKASLTDTLQKIKDGNLMSLKKGAVPTTCPLSFEINFVFSNKQITFDLCKVFSSVASSLYVFFYLVFFVLFLVLIIKLFLFTFMGW